MRCQVETYSGSRLHEVPRRFRRQETWLEVAEILKRWRSPGQLSFKVRAVDGRVYLLTYLQDADAWEAEPAETDEAQRKSAWE